MKKVSEKVAEELKTLGGRVCDTGSFHGRTALGEVIDNIGELPEFAQLPVIKAYKHLFSLGNRIDELNISFHDLETEA